MPDPRQTILLTGFGPFPGTPDNVTSRLAPELASVARLQLPGHHVVAEVLPTEWQRASQRLAQLYAELAPTVALHFGVSDRATGFALETTAMNRCKSAPDAAGCLPSSAQIETDGPCSIGTQLPAQAIYERLTALNIPVQWSDDAGDYLCNSIFYATLRHAAAAPHPTTAGFIHIPKTLAPEGDAQHGNLRPFDWNMLLQGSLEIIRVCLGRTSPFVTNATALSGSSAGSASRPSHS